SGKPPRGNRTGFGKHPARTPRPCPVANRAAQALNGQHDMHDAAGRAWIPPPCLPMRGRPTARKPSGLKKWNTHTAMTAARPLDLPVPDAASPAAVSAPLRGALDVERIDTWVFDLDNTLYHPRANLFAQIDQRMAAFIMELLSVEYEAARTLQKRYFMEYGTTLRGLMRHYGVNPRRFLDYVHDIDLTVVGPDAGLARALEALPGRKLIFTNGDTPYARR